MKVYSPGVSHDEFMKKELRRLEFAAEFLNACLEENDPPFFFRAMRKVLEAHGGITRAARLAKLNRVSLYKMFQEDGNPGFENVLKVLHAIGLTVNFGVKPGKKSRLQAKSKSRAKAA